MERKEIKDMTVAELDHAIDCAYDCDQPEWVAALEAERKTRPTEAIEAQPDAVDMFADSSKLL